MRLACFSLTKITQLKSRPAYFYFHVTFMVAIVVKQVIYNNKQIISIFTTFSNKKSLTIAKPYSGMNGPAETIRYHGLKGNLPCKLGMSASPQFWLPSLADDNLLY